jgi:uncharacterized protein YqjF (DUF2071 family)
VQNDFPPDVLSLTAHRPWPLPEEPWLMTQSWHDVLFAHWPVDTRELRDLVPAELPLDLFEGRAYAGVVPFDMTNVAPRFVPALPLVSAFPELNVRTYVKLGDKPGVYFFSLDAESLLAVTTARALLGLPYFHAAMDVRRSGEWVHYSSSRATSSSGAPAVEFTGRYRPLGEPHAPVAGTLEHFLTERYCLYTVRHSRVHRLEIHHPPWPLQLAEAVIERNTMAAAAGITLPASAPLLHYAKRQDMVAFSMKTVA